MHWLLIVVLATGGGLVVHYHRYETLQACQEGAMEGYGLNPRVVAMTCAPESKAWGLKKA